MGILDEDVARVREATDIAAVIGEHVGLRRVGRRLSGLCPFHTEKTPSFSVNPELGLYYCFGCQASGDAITFVRELEHLDFVGAVERLATKANITLRYDDKAQHQARGRRGRLVEAAAAAVDFYHRRLLEGSDAGLARRYLRSRGLGGDVVRRFSIGWSPDDWDVLSRYLQAQKFSRDDLTEAGLAFVNRANKLQDQFRGRVMFPIYDVSGDPVAFGGRALGDQGPKYVNTPETSIYRKRRVLYGLNWAKGEIVAKSEVVVAEGYTDVIACHVAGVPQAVATCGTALADDHVRLLKRFASRVVLAYDADAAGQAAAERFYAWESEFELELAVAALGEGRDPADVWRDDPDLLAKAVSEARPFLRFRIERLLDRADRSSAEGRARAANGAIALVAEHPDVLVRDQYVMELADELGIDADRMRASVEEARRSPRRAPRQQARQQARRGDRQEAREQAGHATPVDEAPPDDEPPDEFVLPEDETVDRREVAALQVAVQHPELVPEWLDESYFASPGVHQAFVALLSADTFPEAVEQARGSVQRMLQRLAVEEIPAGDDLTTYALEVMMSVLEEAARRVELRLARSGDERSSEGKRLLEAMRAARDPWDPSAANQVAKQLVTWVAAARAEG